MSHVFQTPELGDVTCSDCLDVIAQRLQRAKPIIPVRLIPSPGSQAIVGRYYSQRPAYQDGGQFYDLETGDLVTDLGQFFAGDGDAAGAAMARERFLATHPWYRIATPDEVAADGDPHGSS